MQIFSASDSFIRTIPLVSESHRISRKARGLYRQWRIALRPETDYTCIILLFMLFVNRLFVDVAVVLVENKFKLFAAVRTVDFAVA